MGVLFVAWFGNWSECVASVCVCVQCAHTHTPYVSIPTGNYSIVCVHVCFCVCLCTPYISPICGTILAAFLFKPLCPSCATSTMKRPIAYSHGVHSIKRMMHMVLALRTAFEISCVVVSVFFFFSSAPVLCRYNSSPRALCFISLSPWWILGCHAESLTLSITLY